MTSIGTVSPESTKVDLVAKARDEFIAMVAKANNVDLGDVDAWANADLVGEDAAAEINGTIENELGEDYDTATFELKGIALWDANARKLRQNLEGFQGVSYDNLSDEARAALDTAANIHGPEKATKLFEEKYFTLRNDGVASSGAALAAFTGVSNAATDWANGALADELNAIDTKTNLVASAFEVHDDTATQIKTQPQKGNGDTDGQPTQVIVQNGKKGAPEDAPTATVQSTDNDGQATQIITQNGKDGTGGNSETVTVQSDNGADTPAVTTTSAQGIQSQMDDMHKAIVYSKTLADAAVAGLGDDVTLAAKDLTREQREVRDDAIGRAAQGVADAHESLGFMKQSIDALADGNPDKATLLANYTALEAEVSDAASYVRPKGRALAEVIDKQATLVGEMQEYLPTYGWMSGLSELSTANKPAANNRKDKNLDEYYGDQVLIPETYIRENAQSLAINTGYGNKNKLDDKDIIEHMSKPTLATHVTNRYINDLNLQLNDALNKEGYSNLELAVNDPSAQAAYEAALTKLYEMQYADPKVALHDAVVVFKQEVENLGLTYIDIAPFVEPENPFADDVLAAQR